MTVTPDPKDPPDERIELEDVPEQEGLSKADAAARLNRDPDEQPNKEDVAGE
jgi:hypothetical protein